MRTRIIAACAVALILAAVPSLAHHTAAYTYDITKPVPLSGTVTVVEWKQPGDPISMTVCVAKDGTNTAYVHSITVPRALENKVGTC